MAFGGQDITEGTAELSPADRVGAGAVMAAPEALGTGTPQ